MNNKEALQALLDGKKIRRAAWSSNRFVCLNEDGFGIDEEGDFRVIYLTNMPYEIYQEPKRKVKYAPALCVLTSGGVFITQQVFRDEEDARRNCTGFKRLLWDRAVEIDE